MLKDRKSTLKTGNFLWDNKHWFLAGFLLAAFIYFIFQNNYDGDYWVHLAAIKELIKNPVSPEHPYILSNASSPYFSPYHLIVSLVSEILGTDAETSLNLVAVFNFIILFLGLYYFIKEFKFSRNAGGVFFWAQIFVLFLWVGGGGYRHSGYFNFDSLVYTVAYPSTFVQASFLWMTVWYRNLIKYNQWLLFIPILALFPLALLSYPQIAICWIIFWIIYTIVHIYYRKKYFRIIPLILILGISFSIITLYPYYSFYDLLDEKAGLYNSLSRANYTAPLYCIIFFILMLPVIFTYYTNPSQKSILFTILALIIIYFSGKFTGNYGWGRTASMICFFSQVALADILNHFANKYVSWIKLNFKRVYLGVLILFFALLMLETNTAWLTSRVKNENNALTALGFLNEKIKQNDVIMTNLYNAPIVTMFGGRLVASSVYPLYFIDDEKQRLKSVKDFFNDTTTNTTREHIIDEYDVKWVLTDKTAPGMSKILALPFYNQNKIFENDRYLLIRTSLAN